MYKIMPQSAINSDVAPLDPAPTQKLTSASAVGGRWGQEEGIEKKLEEGERVEQKEGKEMRHDKEERQTEVCLRMKDNRAQRKVGIQASSRGLSSGIQF